MIETEFNGHIFGCFTSGPIPDYGNHYVKDDKAFLCVIRSCFEDKKPVLCRIKEDATYKAYYHAYFQSLPQ